MSVEYWLVDAESGRGQGCYLTLEDALVAAELEGQATSIHNLRLLGMTSSDRQRQPASGPEPQQRVFVRFDLGMTEPL